MKGSALMHRHRSKPHRLARGERGIEAVEDPHLVGAVAFTVQIEHHGRPVASAKLTAPAGGGAGLQGRGDDVRGHQVAGVKQQA